MKGGREKNRKYRLFSRGFYVKAVVGCRKRATREMILSDYAKEHIEEIVSRGNWKFAKTMKKFPHEYVVKGESIGLLDYICLHRYILIYGEDRKFFKTTIKYLFVDEYKYWYMSDNLNISRIINRARI